jgi:hypothetical protein
MGEPGHNVEVYSTFLRIRGEMNLLPGQRVSDEVNRLVEYLELHNTVTEPLLSSYPVVSPQESNTTIAKSSIVLIVPEEQNGSKGADGNRILWREKARYHVVLNTTAFALSADLHLDPKVSLLDQLQRSEREFIPLTRVSAVVVASLGGTPQTLQREFALVNPASVVSFSVRSEVR